MSTDEIDVYKCCAVNEYGKAVCTASLKVTDGKDSFRSAHYFNFFKCNFVHIFITSKMPIILSKFVVSL